MQRYRSEIKTQPKNNNLDYLIDPTFRNINTLFAISFKNVNNDLARIVGNWAAQGNPKIPKKKTKNKKMQNKNLQSYNFILFIFLFFLNFQKVSQISL